MTSLSPAAALALVDRRCQLVGDEGDVEVEPNLGRRRVGDDQERRPGGVLGSVAHLVAPAVRSVGDVEQSATHHHRARGLGGLTEHFPVDLVVAEHPGVQGLAASA
jgi:hypothetical protein